jgi:DNA-binding CsgD family transcriptional regulator
MNSKGVHGMPDLTDFEVLSNLQLLQDLLSEQLDLFLVLIDQNANEITLPSKMPLFCFENALKDAKCKNCLASCVANYTDAANDQPLYQCHRNLYAAIIKTNMQYFKPIYLVGGYTSQPDYLITKRPLLEAIFKLPLTLTANTPLVQPSTIAIGNTYGLTQQELNILRYMVNGLTNQDIATKLFISLSTVKTHIAHILTKLKVSNRTEAAMVALQNGVWGQHEHL